MANEIFSNIDKDFINATDKMLRDQVNANFAYELEHFKKLGLGEKPSRILDIGCGNAYYLSKLALEFPELNFVGIDLNKELIKQGHKYIKEFKLNNVSLEHCSFIEYHPSEPFDFILSISTLLHTPNLLDKYFTMAYNSLNKNGRLIIIDCDDQFWLIYPEYAIFKKLLDAISSGYKQKNVDRYIARKLPGYLKNNGFKDIIFKPNCICNLHVGNNIVFDLMRAYAKIFSDKDLFTEKDLDELENKMREVDKSNDFLYVSPGVLISGVKT